MELKESDLGDLSKIPSTLALGFLSLDPLSYQERGQDSRYHLLNKCHHVLACLVADMISFKPTT